MLQENQHSVKMFVMLAFMIARPIINIFSTKVITLLLQMGEILLSNLCEVRAVCPYSSHVPVGFVRY